MKRWIQGFVVGISALLLQPSAFSQMVPSLINYQGRLLSGTNLVNGSVGLSLSLFDSPTGGTLLYTDSNTVMVVDGLYSTFLGDNTTVGNLQSALENTNVWVEVVVNGTVLSPRERVVSVAYALGARTAQGVVANAITASMIATGAIQSHHLAAGSVSSAAIADGAVAASDLGSNAVTTAAVADGTLLPTDFGSTNRSGHFSIPNPIPEAFEQFGFSVAGIDEDRFVIGSLRARGTFPDTGAAYLYDGGADLLSRLTLTVPPGSGVDLYGHSACALPDGGFAIGAANFQSMGIVLLYDRDGNLTNSFMHPAPTGADNFGFSVASAGSDKLVVGVPLDDEGAVNAGSVVLYDMDAGFLSFLVITNPTPFLQDIFGFSVARVGTNHFVVGAPSDNTGASDTGSAYLYDAAGVLQLTLTNPAAGPGDSFGHAVAGVGSNLFVVTAPQSDLPTTNSGVAYVYNITGSLIATITNPAPAAFDAFGQAVAPVGSDRFVISAMSNDLGGVDAGIAHVFRTDGVLVASFTNPSPSSTPGFGLTVGSLGANRVLVGAPGDDTYDTDAGKAFLFQFDTQAAAGLRADSVAPNSVGLAELDTDSIDARYVLRSGDVMDGRLGAPAFAPSHTNTTVASQVGEYVRRTAPIAFLSVTGTTSLAVFNQYNCSVGRLGVGSYRITFVVAPSNAFYSPVITPIANAPRFATVTNRTTTAFEFRVLDSAGTAQDGAFSAVVFGGF